MKFSGRVTRGVGQGARFLALEWVQRELQQKVGLTPFPGTLNLQVTPEIRDALFGRRHSLLQIADASAPECPGYLARTTLRAHGITLQSAYLILPEQTVHNNVIEIIAPVSLREALHIPDGEAVEVEIQMD